MIEQFDVDTLSVEIHYDDSPRDFGDEFENDEDSKTIICSFFHTRSVIGQYNPFSSVEEALEFATDKHYFVFNLWRYEHGLVSFSAGAMGADMGYPYNCQFDSGIEGFILVKKDEHTPDEESALEAANSYLEYLSDWCNGSIYGYIIKDQDGDELESCWGFVGYDHVEEEAKSVANALLESLPKQLEMEGLSV